MLGNYVTILKAMGAVFPGLSTSTPYSGLVAVPRYYTYYHTYHHVPNLHSPCMVYFTKARSNLIIAQSTHARSKLCGLS